MFVGQYWDTFNYYCGRECCVCVYVCESETFDIHINYRNHRERGKRFELSRLKKELKSWKCNTVNEIYISKTCKICKNLIIRNNF